ncbi:MAG: hypothetical protein LBM75_03125 [Myxococcales bacterium]|nr:hypothetical protein [Myxococcales bacterium]
MDASQNRLMRAEAALQSTVALQAQLNGAALLVATRASDVLQSLDELLPLQSSESSGPAANLAMAALRAGVAAALTATGTKAALTPDDLVLAQTAEGIFVLDGKAHQAHFRGKAEAFPDLAEALAPSARGLVFEFGEQLYSSSALELRRTLPAPPATETMAEIAPTETATETETETPKVPEPKIEADVIVAIARRIDSATAAALSRLVGVDVTFAMNGDIVASSIAVDDEAHRAAIAATRASGPLSLIPFEKFAALPIPLPLFAKAPIGSHEARVSALTSVDGADAASGARLILDTRRDGLLQIATIQKYVILGLLGFFSLGALFLLLIGRQNTGRPSRLMPLMRNPSPTPIPAPEEGKTLQLTSDKKTEAAEASATPPAAEAQGQQIADQPPPMLTPTMLQAEDFDFASIPPVQIPASVLMNALSPQKDQAALADEVDAYALVAAAAVEEPRVALADDAPGDIDDGHQAARSSNLADLQSLEPTGSVEDTGERQQGHQVTPPLDSAMLHDLQAAHDSHPARPMEPASLQQLDTAAAHDESAEVGSSAADDANARDESAAPSGLPQLWPQDLVHQQVGAELSPNAAPVDEADPDELQFHILYEQFIDLREQCGEPIDSPTYETFAFKLRLNRDQLMQKYGCASVRFQVYLKAGKAALRATPVRA